MVFVEVNYTQFSVNTQTGPPERGVSVKSREHLHKDSSYLLGHKETHFPRRTTHITEGLFLSFLLEDSSL